MGKQDADDAGCEMKGGRDVIKCSGFLKQARKTCNC